MIRLMVMNGLLICLILIWTSSASEPPKELRPEDRAEAPSRSNGDPQNISKKPHAYAFASSISAEEDDIDIDNFNIINPHLGNDHTITRYGNQTFTRARGVDQKDPRWSEQTPACIWRHNDREFTTTTIENCKDKCQTETTFMCRSIDYIPSSGRCVLTKEDSTSESYKQPCPGSYKETIFTEIIPDQRWSQRILACIWGHNDKELTTTTIENCKEKCEAETTFMCRSIDYIPNSGRCVLTKEDSTSGSYKQPCPGSYKETIFTEIIPDPRWSEQTSACIWRHNDRKFTTPTIENCKDKCQRETTFMCRSIDYIPSSGRCILTKEDSTSESYKQPCPGSYKETIFTEIIPDQRWSQRFLACILDHNDKELTTRTIGICREKCETETTFICRSIDYVPSSGKCVLNKKDSTSESYKQPCPSSYKETIFVEIIPDKIWSEKIHACIWRHNDKELKTTTIEICKDKCRRETTFLCRSIDYVPSSGRCVLTRKNSTSGSYKQPCPGSYKETIFTEIIPECTDTLKETSCNAIKKNDECQIIGKTLCKDTCGFCPSNGTKCQKPSFLLNNTSRSQDSRMGEARNLATCNLVWNIRKEHRPLILIRRTLTIVPPYIDPWVKNDHDRIGSTIYLIFACPGEGNIFKYVPGSQTRLHGRCVAQDQFEVCVNSYPTRMSLRDLSCSKKMYPSIIPQEVNSANRMNCNYIGGQLYKIGYTFGDSVATKVFQPVDIEVCFREKDETTLWTAHVLDGREISTSVQNTDPPDFRTGRGFFTPAMNTIYSQKSQGELFDHLLGNEQNLFCSLGKFTYLQKGHMAPAGDFVTKAEKDATYLFVNAQPQWNVINSQGGNWHVLEENIRTFSKINNGEFLIIYTGSYSTLSIENKEIYLSNVNENKNKVPVPYGTWKVVISTSKQKAVAFIVINNPFTSPPNNFQGGDQCAKSNGLKIKPDDYKKGHTYCFKVADFRVAYPTSGLPPLNYVDEDDLLIFP